MDCLLGYFLLVAHALTILLWVLRLTWILSLHTTCSEFSCAVILTLRTWKVFFMTMPATSTPTYWVGSPGSGSIFVVLLMECTSEDIKKTKKGGNKSDGHLGCSNGYDGLAYKPHLHDHFNSEGREQIHSLLEKVSSSFRQTNFTSFMHLHRIFFGIRNLKSKGLI